MPWRRSGSCSTAACWHRKLPAWQPLPRCAGPQRPYARQRHRQLNSLLLRRRTPSGWSHGALCLRDTGPSADPDNAAHADALTQAAALARAAGAEARGRASAANQAVAKVESVEDSARRGAAMAATEGARLREAWLEARRGDDGWNTPDSRSRETQVVAIAANVRACLEDAAALAEDAAKAAAAVMAEFDRELPLPDIKLLELQLLPPNGQAAWVTGVNVRDSVQDPAAARAWYKATVPAETQQHASKLLSARDLQFLEESFPLVELIMWLDGAPVSTAERAARDAMHARLMDKETRAYITEHVHLDKLGFLPIFSGGRAKIAMQQYNSWCADALKAAEAAAAQQRATAEVAAAQQRAAAARPTCQHSRRNSAGAGAPARPQPRQPVRTAAGATPSPHNRPPEPAVKRQRRNAARGPAEGVQTESDCGQRTAEVTIDPASDSE
ncbi:hypothetical protein Agub_g14377 [Astrephomene gubernaculifera]|uniref:Uncharacterized protein n=1 Tax=Astrephomene gubernaculifera TaxID=47775 RepID=A0AAD3E1C9_9CHLO|nr:hypothetical protein Agub_g14377 [Astrephomene gubernaculifera]